MSVILTASKSAATSADRGTGRIATRTYQVTLPTGTATATIPQGYLPNGGGEIARLRRLFPTMTAAAMVA